MLLGAARNKLNMSEEEFWKTTPRKLNALLEACAIMSGVKEEEQKGFIDNIEGW